ncbi:MAG: M48 family metallopeptidase [Pseudomonadota bacterium]
MEAVPATYFDGISARPQPASLYLRGAWLIVDGATVAREEPLAALDISEPLGAAPRVVRFADGAHCEVHAPAAFAALLREAGIGDGFVVRLQARWHWALAAVVLTLASAFAGYHWGLPAAADWIAARLPARLLAGMGESTLAVFDEHVFRPSALPAARQAALAAAFDRLAPAHGAAPAHRIVFRDGGAIGANAFALPDGTIVVTDQLVDSAGDDSEIFGVLAHELGHLDRRHGLRMLIQGSMVGVLVGWYLGDVSSVAAGVPAALLQARYSREFEREADTYAGAMLERNGIPPAVLARILGRMQTRAECTHGSASDPFRGYLRSHPATQERIARLGGERPAWPVFGTQGTAPPLGDTEITQLLVGSWAVSPQDPTFAEPGAISTYRADGSLEFTAYTDNTCTAAEFHSTAQWLVRDGLLVIHVITSEQPDSIQPGATIVDRVVSIDAQQAVLESKCGTLQYRVRRATCVPPGGGPAQ